MLEDQGEMLERKMIALVCRERMLEDGGRVLLALSGGADSMALLHAMLRLAPERRWQVAAAHVHHGLRGAEADRDEAFVRRWCGERGIPLFVRHADVAAEAAAAGEGLEEAGRRIRYAFLEEVRRREGFDRIATAHTASDNVETLLLHLARGCGPSGLCGIRPMLGNCIRPLLDCSREEIESYCRENGIPYVTDSTNADTAFRRNRIRAEGIAALRAVNPRLEEAASRLARQARADEAYFLEQTARLLEEARVAENAYDRRRLADAPEAIRSRALRRAAGSAEEKHIRAIESLLCHEGSVTLPGGRRVTARGNRLLFGGGEAAEGTPFFALPLAPGGTCEICGRIYRLERLTLEEYEKKKKVYKNLLKNTMNYAKITGAITVRQRLPGDRYRPAGRRCGKTLKKLFNEAEIPLEERERLPVLCDEAGILQVAGFVCDERAAVEDPPGDRLFFHEEADRPAAEIL